MNISYSQSIFQACVLFLLGCSQAGDLPTRLPEDISTSASGKITDRVASNDWNASLDSIDKTTPLEKKVELQLIIEEIDSPDSFMRTGKTLMTYGAVINLHNRCEIPIQIYKEIGSDREVWMRVWDEKGALVSRKPAAMHAMRPDPQGGGLAGVWQVVSGIDVSIPVGGSQRWEKEISRNFHLSKGQHSVQAYLDVHWIDGHQNHATTLESNIVEFLVRDTQ